MKTQDEYLESAVTQARNDLEALGKLAERLEQAQTKRAMVEAVNLSNKLWLLCDEVGA